MSYILVLDTSQSEYETNALQETDADMSSVTVLGESMPIV